MFLTKEEREKILESFGLGDASEVNHYQVKEDVWIYLFEKDRNKYVLISADYMDYEYDHFPHLLRFPYNGSQTIDLVLQEEIKSNNLNKTQNCAMFKYVN